jgi:hypothetical protein
MHTEFCSENRKGRDCVNDLGVDGKNAWSYTFTPQYAFMAWCSDKKVKAQGQFYLYLYLISLRDVVLN